MKYINYFCELNCGMEKVQFYDVEVIIIWVLKDIFGGLELIINYSCKLVLSIYLCGVQGCRGRY